ncbi:MAG: hypothetical protein APR62_01260 [Smithella sp. SDB]|nr:MAG: hypothetical protein APR62_01260 [Smithella sp. SDB]
MRHFYSSRHKTFLYFFFLLPLISICFSQRIYADDDWKLVKNADGVEVYVRPYKNSKINESKGIVTVPASTDIVYAIISYAPLHKRLMHGCYDSFLIQPWENGCQVHYFAFKAPWPLWDRDLIYETCAKLDHETGNIVVTSRVVENASVPIKDKVVRVTDSNNTWTLEKLGPEKTRITYQNYLNPGVAKIIPQTFVNFICKDVPYYSLVNMRNLVKEPIYKELAPQYRLE